jgi:TatD DNase family protein
MIDSHCHLADDVFAADAAAVMARAETAGVLGAICILEATACVELERAVALRTAWPALRFTAGVHPHRAAAGGDEETVTRIVTEALEAVDGCAIGETGLDYHYDFAPRDVQRRVFAAQIRLARARDLPLIIHTREADADVIGVLAAEGGRAVRSVFHCFTGDAALASAALDLGACLSFSGILTFPKAEALRAVAAQVPRDRVLIETDSPYLAPVPHRGTRNEPAHVTRVAAVLADLWQVPVEEVVRQTTATARTLFRW